MKKIIISTFLSLATLVAFAQLPTFGVKGGLNFAQYVQPGYPTSQFLTTFNGGIFADFKLGNFSLQPALNYTGKGGNYHGKETLTDAQGNNLKTVNTLFVQKLYYLELPLNLIYHIPVVIGNIYFGAGPYIARGISANSTFTGAIYTGEVVTQKEDINFGNGVRDLKTTQFGADAIAGFKFNNGFLLNIYYDLGLTNDIATQPYNAGISKSRVFGVSIGYCFP